MASYTGKRYDLYEETSFGRDKRRREDLITKDSNNLEYDNSNTASIEETKSIYNGPAAVYEGSIYIPKKVTYSMPKKTNTNLIKDEEKEMFLKSEEQFEQISEKSFKGQLEAYRRNNAASVWKLLSSGDLATSSLSKSKAKADVSEDGYWGVKNTSERLFDFAMTMSEGKPDRMKNMRVRMELAADSVTSQWGSELPGLCQETIQNTRRLFADYLAKEGEIIS
jgi:hypothetical protein